MQMPKNQFRLLSRNLNEDDIITIDDLGEKESFVDYLLKNTTNTGLESLSRPFLLTLVLTYLHL